MKQRYVYSVMTDDGLLVSADITLLRERMMKEGIRGEIKRTVLPTEQELLGKWLR